MPAIAATMLLAERGEDEAGEQRRRPPGGGGEHGGDELGLVAPVGEEGGDEGGEEGVHALAIEWGQLRVTVP